MNWQRKHYECKGNLFCSVGIRNGDEWIWKDDCGAETYTEKEKVKHQTRSNGVASIGA